MSQKKRPAPPETEELLEHIREIQEEIVELDEDISRQVDAVVALRREHPPEALRHVMAALDEEEDEESRRTFQFLLRVKEDWDALYTRICAFNDDDEELLEGLLYCVGDMLLAQPVGMDQRWIRHLEQYVEKQRASSS